MFLSSFTLVPLILSPVNGPKLDVGDGRHGGGPGGPVDEGELAEAGALGQADHARPVDVDVDASLVIIIVIIIIIITIIIITWSMM